MPSGGSNSILWRSVSEKPLCVDTRAIFQSTGLKSRLVRAVHGCVGNRVPVSVLEIKIARCFLQVDCSDVVSHRCCEGLIVTANSVLLWMSRYAPVSVSNFPV